jgi:hypothetical protein
MDRFIISINILTYLKFNEIEDKSKSEAKVVPARRFQVYPTFFFFTNLRNVYHRLPQDHFQVEGKKFLEFIAST